MNTRILAVLLATGCVTAAAGGAYLAVRQNADRSQAVTTAAPVAPAAKAVTETEAVVDSAPAPAPKPDAPVTQEQKTIPVGAAPQPKAVRATKPEPAHAAEAPRRSAPAAPVSEPVNGSVRAAGAVNAPAERPAAEPSTPAPVSEPVAERTPEPRQQAPQAAQFEEVVLPASSVLGLQVETALSSERSRIEDRVEARVTRDVTAGGRLAVPAGSRVLGSVTVVDRGGKMKDRARLGVRFHTLVLADGREVPLRTEAIIREGESPANESARKIGGAAVGGAILGAIIGGGKGAMMGGAAGAAGGSAVVMTGDRNAATLPAGTVVSVRLSAPATIEMERAPQ
jgi:type IV secretory pathway VirB10-like protein